MKLLYTILIVLILLNTNTFASTRDGLVGWWKFEEGTGTNAADSSWNGNAGTLTNSPTWVSNCPRGNCISYQATNAYTLLGTPTALNLTGTMSISCWIYPTVSDTQARGIVANLDAPGNLSQWSLEYGRTAQRIGALANGASVAVTGSNDVSLNKWHYVAMTRSGSTGNWTYTLYLDGALDNSASGVANNPNAQQSASIGRYGAFANDSFTFKGAIDDVRIYNRAITAQEVKDLYNAGQRLNYAPGT